MWPSGQQPFGPNRVPLLTGLSSTDGTTPVPVAVNPSNGAVQNETVVVTTQNQLYVGQQTVNTTAVQLTDPSVSLTNGIIIKAPSTNAENIYVGGSDVTSSTGDILEPGESRGYPISDPSLIYIISAASTTDKVSYEGN